LPATGRNDVTARVKTNLTGPPPRTDIVLPDPNPGCAAQLLAESSASEAAPAITKGVPAIANGDRG
jgi:hypothetical protein